MRSQRFIIAIVLAAAAVAPGDAGRRRAQGGDRDAGEPIPSDADGLLHRVALPDWAEGAVPGSMVSAATCMDRTVPWVYVRRREAAVARGRWLAWFPSGNVCTTVELCEERRALWPYLFSSGVAEMYPEVANDGTPSEAAAGDRVGADGRLLDTSGWLSPHAEVNAAFHDWNHLYVPYCSQDLFLGAGQSGEDAFEGRFVQAGGLIARSALAGLFSRFGAEMQRVVVGGASAGGFVPMTQSRWLVSAAAVVGAELALMTDSSFWISFRGAGTGSIIDIPEGTPTPDWMEPCTWSASDFNDTRTADDPHPLPPDSDTACCALTHCVLQRWVPPEIPVLVLTARFDVFELRQLQQVLGSLAMTREALFGSSDEDLDDTPIVSLAAVAGYGERRAALLSSLTDTRPGLSIIVPACMQHDLVRPFRRMEDTTSVTLRSSLQFDNRALSVVAPVLKVGPASARTTLDLAVAEWARSDHGFQLTVMQDDCSDPSCNPTCPERLVVLDAAPLFDTAEGVELVLVFALAAMGALPVVGIIVVKVWLWRFRRFLARHRRVIHSDEWLAQRDTLTSTRNLAMPATRESHASSFVGRSSLANLPRMSLVCREARVAVPCAESDGKEGQKRQVSSTSVAPVAYPKLVTLLDGVTFAVEPGTVLGVMGHSGSGKTSLLRYLSGRLPDGAREQGEVWLGGFESREPEFGGVLKKQIGFVSQTEAPEIPHLTVRMNLIFAANLVLPELTWQARADRVEDIITALGLEACANVKVGSAKESGIGAGGASSGGLSGGQRRLLACGFALLRRPAVLILDEVCSGLDTAMAHWLVQQLAELAAATGMCVILSIHQPRIEVFELFSKCLVLVDGRTAYYGSTNRDTVADFLANALKPFLWMDEDGLDGSDNVADFLMDCAASRPEYLIEHFQTRVAPTLQAYLSNVIIQARRARDPRRSVDKATSRVSAPTPSRTESDSGSDTKTMDEPVTVLKVDLPSSNSLSGAFAMDLPFNPMPALAEVDDDRSSTAGRSRTSSRTGRVGNAAQIKVSRTGQAELVGHSTQSVRSGSTVSVSSTEGAPQPEEARPRCMKFIEMWAEIRRTITAVSTLEARTSVGVPATEVYSDVFVTVVAALLVGALYFGVSTPWTLTVVFLAVFGVAMQLSTYSATVLYFGRLTQLRADVSAGNVRIRDWYVHYLLRTFSHAHVGMASSVVISSLFSVPEHLLTVDRLGRAIIFGVAVMMVSMALTITALLFSKSGWVMEQVFVVVQAIAGICSGVWFPNTNETGWHIRIVQLGASALRAPASSHRTNMPMTAICFTPLAANPYFWYTVSIMQSFLGEVSRACPNLMDDVLPPRVLLSNTGSHTPAGWPSRVRSRHIP